MHLDDCRHDALLAGTLSREEALALARHLEAGCEPCEAFLAARRLADTADGRVDRALAALADTRAEGTDGAGHAGTEEEFDAISRRLGARPGRRPRWARRLAPALAAAAVLVAVGGAGVALLVRSGPTRPPWDGVKGPAGPVAVRLRFLVVQGEGGRAALRRGASGDAVPAQAGLGFEVEIARPAHVALLRVPAGGPPDAFWAGTLDAGRTVITLGDRPAAYRLEGLAGRQRFVAVASEAPLGPDALARAAAAVAAGAAAPEVAGSDVVEVRIE